MIPIGKDLPAFERTLISVLENPVEGSEVLVCHDGSYDDPFALGDEIRFVIADSDSPLDLISAGASQSRGRFVHVLSDGLRATSGWTDEALEAFEAHDCGIVSPVIRHDTQGTIVSAGWSDGIDRLCQSASRGHEEIESSERQPTGAYLPASFWRRELLRSLTDCITSADVMEASYAFHHLASKAGWTCSLVSESEVLFDEDSLPWNQPSLTRGIQTQCLKNYFSCGGWPQSLSAAFWAVFASLTRPGQLLEAVGRGLAPTARPQLIERLIPNKVAACNQHETVVGMPSRDLAIEQTRRRAA